MTSYVVCEICEAEQERWIVETAGKGNGLFLGLPVPWDSWVCSADCLAEWATDKGPLWLDGEDDEA